MALARTYVHCSRVCHPYLLVLLYLERKELISSNQRMNLTRNGRVRFWALVIPAQVMQIVKFRNMKTIRRILWFVMSTIFTPAALFLLGVSGITPMYFSSLGLTKNSRLPPFEFFPFIILPLIGTWFAMKGYKGSRILWALILCIIINLVYAGVVVFIIIDIWIGGRT